MLIKREITIIDLQKIQLNTSRRKRIRGIKGKGEEKKKGEKMRKYEKK